MLEFKNTFLKLSDIIERYTLDKQISAGYGESEISIIIN